MTAGAMRRPGSDRPFIFRSAPKSRGKKGGTQIKNTVKYEKDTDELQYSTAECRIFFLFLFSGGMNDTGGEKRQMRWPQKESNSRKRIYKRKRAAEDKRSMDK